MRIPAASVAATTAGEWSTSRRLQRVRDLPVQCMACCVNAFHVARTHATMLPACQTHDCCLDNTIIEFYNDLTVGVHCWNSEHWTWMTVADRHPRRQCSLLHGQIVIKLFYPVCICLTNYFQVISSNVF